MPERLIGCTKALRALIVAFRSKTRGAVGATINISQFNI
jgi:hypothetical protein